MASTLSGLSNLNWSPQGLMGSFQSMGAKATSPATNVTPPSNTIKPNLATPNTPSGLSLASYNKSTQASNPGLFGSPTTAQMAANRAATVAGSNGMLKEVNGQVVSASQPATSNGGSSTSQPTPPATPTVTTPPNVYTQSTQNLSNTQPTTGTTNAIDTSQGIANNQGTNAPAGTPGAYANTATTGLLGLTQGQTPQVTQAEQQYNTLAQQSPVLQAELAGNPNIASEVASGRGQVLGSQLAGQLQGASQNVQNTLTGQGQQITAGTDAASAANTTQGQQLTGANQAGQLANTAQSNQISAQGTAGTLTQPVQVPYSNQYISPSTGQPVGGGAAGQLPPDAQAAVNSYAKQVQNGSMTRQDAESRLSAYGVAGTNALNAALGPNFNTNASNASAQTTATGQAIQTAATATNSALDTLGSLFNNLSSLQTGGIPLTDSIANWFANKMGQTGLTQYQTALSDARSQLIGVLNASGGTPTGNEAKAMQYLPDNMTVGQFQQLVGTAQNPGTARQLVQQKVSAFTNSGTQNGNSSTGSSGGGWASLGD